MKRYGQKREDEECREDGKEGGTFTASEACPKGEIRIKQQRQRKRE